MLVVEYKGKKYTKDIDRFAYDGCHKIYLILTKEDESEATGYDYRICDLQVLPITWQDSCSLKFIQYWNLDASGSRPLIPQCTDALIWIDPVGDVHISIEDESGDFHIDELVERGMLDAH